MEGITVRMEGMVMIIIFILNFTIIHIHVTLIIALLTITEF